MVSALAVGTERAPWHNNLIFRDLRLTNHCSVDRSDNTPLCPPLSTRFLRQQRKDRRPSSLILPHLPCNPLLESSQNHNNPSYPTQADGQPLLQTLMTCKPLFEKAYLQCLCLRTYIRKKFRYFHSNLICSCM